MKSMAQLARLPAAMLLMTSVASAQATAELNRRVTDESGAILPGVTVPATQGDTGLPVEERRAVFIAGDDGEAKRTVARLIEEIGFAAVDTGPLGEGGRRQQVGTPVYNRELNARQAAEVLAAG